MSINIEKINIYVSNISISFFRIINSNLGTRSERVGKNIRGARQDDARTTDVSGFAQRLSRLVIVKSVYSVQRRSK